MGQRYVFIVPLSAIVALAGGSASCPQQPGQVCPAHRGTPIAASIPGDWTSMLQIGVQSQRTVGAMQPGTNHTHGAPPGTLANLDIEGMPGKGMDLPFAIYSVQCSHNTYLLSTQKQAKNKPSTFASSMSLSLGLGYRCIELDVWPRKKKKKQSDVTGGAWTGPPGVSDPAMPSRMKVTHHMMVDLTNNVDPTKFIQNILQWLEADEMATPASTDNPKLPLIISVENHAADTDDEDYLLEVFSWFNHNSVTGEEASRIVKPTEFKAPTATSPGVTLKELAARGVEAGTSFRRIILKSGIKSGSVSKFADLVAMKKFGKDSPGYGSKSIEMGSMTDSEDITSGELAKIESKKAEGALIRTYPHKTAMWSENYDPKGAFEKGAQMVCVNLQGTCPTGTDVCKSVSPGQKGGDDCPCKREFADSIEQMFGKLGYDGYINYQAQGAKVDSWPFTL